MKTVQSTINPKNVVWDDETKLNPKNIVWDNEASDNIPGNASPETKGLMASLMERETNIPRKSGGASGSWETSPDQSKYKNTTISPGNTFDLGRTARNVLGGIGNFVESVGEGFGGGLADKAAAGLTNLFESGVNQERAKYGEKPIPRTTPQEVYQNTRSQLARNTGASQSVVNNPIIEGAGNFAGQTASDMMLIKGSGDLIASPVMKMLTNRFPVLRQPGMLQKMVSGALTAPGFALAKKAIEEGRAPKPMELGKDIMFFMATPMGEEWAGAALNNTALPKLIRAPLEGAAGGIAGLSASTLAGTDEDKQNLAQEMAPTALAQALFHTVGKLGEPEMQAVKSNIPQEAKAKLFDSMLDSFQKIQTEQAKQGKVKRPSEKSTEATQQMLNTLAERNGIIKEKKVLPEGMDERRIDNNSGRIQEIPGGDNAENQEGNYNNSPGWDSGMEVLPVSQRRGEITPQMQGDITQRNAPIPQLVKSKGMETTPSGIRENFDGNENVNPLSVNEAGFSLKEFNRLATKLENGERLTPEEDKRFEKLNNMVDQSEHEQEINAIAEEKPFIKQFIQEEKERKAEAERKFNEEVKSNPAKLFEAKGGLNGKALFVDGKVIYPKDIIKKAEEYFEEDRKIRPDQVNDRGHDFLYAGMGLLKADPEYLNTSFFGKDGHGVHIIKNGNAFNLRYDVDNYLKNTGRVTEEKAFNKIFDAVKALKNDGHNGSLDIPEIGYKGTINDFLGIKEPVKSGIIRKETNGKEGIYGQGHPTATENKTDFKAVIPFPKTRGSSQEEDLSQGLGKNIRVSPPKRRTAMADMGGYAETSEPTGEHAASSETVTEGARISPIQMPELVELAKAINDGKAPRVKEKLGKALGMFHPGSQNIDLRADIFGKQGQATRTLAHEIGHLVDYLPDKTMSRGNILGRIATLKRFMKTIIPEKPGAPGELTEADRARLRKSAEDIINNQKTVENEDIGITPKDVLSIWNDVNAKEKNKELYTYISKLSAAEKKQILKDAFKGQVNFSLPKDTSYKDWSQEIKDKYQELIRQEILKRKLFDYVTINGELRNLTQRWKPFDPTIDPEFTRYRYSSPELYADAISVLFNDPALLKSQAPNFYKAFFNYLEKKPVIKAVYDDIQQRITNPEALGQHRLEGVYQMLKEGNKAREEAVKRGKLEPKKIIDSIEKLFIDRDQPLLKEIRKGKKQGGDTAKLAESAQYQLEETKYMAAEANDYVNSLNSKVMKPLSDAGLNVDDMGAYMLAKRASTERATIANPRGLDEAAAARMLADLKNKLGTVKYAKLEKAVETYRKLREEVIIPGVENAGMYSPEMIDLMKQSKNYAKFSVTHYLEEKFGGQGTARIYKQIGTLSDIENPFIATVTQDISMLRAAKMNEAKTAALDFLKSIDGAAPAEKVFDANIGGQVAKEPKDPDLKLFSVLKDGKMESFYVHKDIVESFEKNPVESNAISRIMSALSNPLKQILVSKNPIWMARNLVRDVKATVKNNPEIRFRDIPKLAKYYNEAFREVVKEVFRGERSEDIAAMYKNYMLNPNRNYSGKDISFDNEIERLVTEFQVNPVDAIKAKGLKGKLKSAWEYLDRFGRVSELTGKVAGYKYLKNETNQSEGSVGHSVRTRIGTPDARRQGSLHQITNSVFMFSNIGKEGLRTSVEAFNANRGTYIWKTMMMNVVPKLALIGAAAYGSDKLKKTIAKIPEYDKQMYDVVPLGMNKAGKAVYIRIPQDYEGQMWGAITWAISGGKFIGARGVMDTIGEQSPYSLNPILKVAGDLYTYYVKGQNPTDDYRGQPIIPQKKFIAGGWPASWEFIKHESKSLGFSPIYSFGDYSDRTTSGMERLLKLPGLSVLGAFLKISDKGDQEKFYAEQDAKKKEQAQRSIKIEDRVINSLKGKDNLPTVPDMVKMYQQLRKENLVLKGTSFPEFKNQYLRYAAKVLPDDDLRMLLKVSKAERIEMLKKLKQEKTPREYAQLIMSLRKMHVSM